ncbi:uncharacterized protein LOC143264590 [Megachile rotundata]|uniref:uncharacterized protein LOC143264590 n=1 Tax=Megachile rotundata TaxID=143995 RepID=UPI003FD3E071
METEECRKRGRDREAEEEQQEERGGKEKKRIREVKGSEVSVESELSANGKREQGVLSDSREDRLVGVNTAAMVAPERTERWRGEVGKEADLNGHFERDRAKDRCERASEESKIRDNKDKEVCESDFQ